MTQSTAGTKTCSKCGVEKPVDDFYFRKDQNRHRAECKVCQKQRIYSGPNYGTYNETRYRASLNYRFRAYGITKDKWDELWLSQEGKCAICRADLVPLGFKAPNRGSKTHTDHCHTTGKVRGLLCCSCNRGIGYLKENPVTLNNAIRYLTKHT